MIGYYLYELEKERFITKKSVKKEKNLFLQYCSWSKEQELKNYFNEYWKD